MWRWVGLDLVKVTRNKHRNKARVVLSSRRSDYRTYPKDERDSSWSDLNRSCRQTVQVKKLIKSVESKRKYIIDSPSSLSRPHVCAVFICYSSSFHLLTPWEFCGGPHKLTPSVLFSLPCSSHAGLPFCSCISRTSTSLHRIIRHTHTHTRLKRSVPVSHTSVSQVKEPCWWSFFSFPFTITPTLHSLSFTIEAKERNA